MLLETLLSIDLNYILIGGIVVLYTMESLMQTQFTFSNRPQHLFQNILFQVIFFICNIFYATVTVYSIEWLNSHQVGLFYYVTAPAWVKLVAGVMMFDFTTYWFHRIAHKVPLLWRFHRVHHSDTAMDASTSFRSHPLEQILWFGTSSIIAAGIFGLNLEALGLYLLIFTPIAFLQHTNLRFPAWLDKSLGLIFTTPNLHKVHHEQDQHYTDSNFADIFIIWDRLFGTYTYKPVNEIKVGLKEFDEPRKQTFWYLFISPFVKIKRIESADPSLRSG
jgi:sterol desaturase/sphingolipid hydroxylase (fatty acid hydroxylase superfamily)